MSARKHLSSLATIQRRIAQRIGGTIEGRKVSFTNAELFIRVLNAERYAILKALLGGDAVTIRELAHRVGRDPRHMKQDITALLHAGIVHRWEDATILFPFDRVHFDVLIKPA